MANAPTSRTGRITTSDLIVSIIVRMIAKVGTMTTVSSRIPERPS